MIAQGFVAPRATMHIGAFFIHNSPEKNVLFVDRNTEKLNTPDLYVNYTYAV